MKYFIAVLVLGFSSCVLSAQAQPVDAKSIAFTHVTVIDMTTAAPLPDMTVIITGNRITALGKSNRVRIPQGAQVSTEEEARQAVRKLKAQGVDFIKVQSALTLPLWQAVLDESRQLNIAVAGHIPERISAFDVARSTQRSIEHISPVLAGDAGV